jgi:hypothetical protein
MSGFGGGSGAAEGLNTTLLNAEHHSSRGRLLRLSVARYYRAFGIGRRPKEF